MPRVKEQMEQEAKAMNKADARAARDARKASLVQDDSDVYDEVEELATRVAAKVVEALAKPKRSR